MKTGLSIRAIACFVLLGLPLAGCDSDSSDNSIQSKSIERPYTIVAIPDTQVYSEEDNLTPIFEKQVNWVLENRSKENIVFATHLGDVVDNGDSQDQWDNAVKALESFFKAPVDFAYSISQGNHDGVEFFTKYLGPERYAGKSWYIGASPNKLNHAQTFKVEHRTFLHINLQKDPKEDAYQWAQSIINNSKYKNLPTIVSTHDYLVYGGRGPTGRDIWDSFIKKNPQIFMVLNGHTHTEYAYVAHNDSNKPVYQMLSDYQDREDGGQGLLRMITIDEKAGKIDVKTYSPGYSIEDDGEIKTVNAFYEEDADSKFTITTNLVERFNPKSTHDFGTEPPKPPLPPAEPVIGPATHVFQERLKNYASTIDTQMNENNPGLDYAGEATLTTDMDDSGSRVNGLLGFMNIIGNGTGQIKQGSRIKSAKIYFHVTSSTGGEISLHRMLMPWSEKTTWYDFTPLDSVTKQPQWEDITFHCPKQDEDITMHVMAGGGIQADGIEARTEKDAAFTCKKGFPTPFIVDVTTSVQAWANGEANFGWALLNNSTDGWDFITSHGGNPPALLVEVEGEPYIQ